MRAIKEDGFSATPFPIILSLEMHCGVEQQDRIAKHLYDYFGKAGQLQVPYDEAEAENFMQLHSPEELKYKVRSPLNLPLCSREILLVLPRAKVLVKGKRLTSKDTENDDEENSLGIDDDANLVEDATADYSTLEGVLSTSSGRHVTR